MDNQINVSRRNNVTASRQRPVCRDNDYDRKTDTCGKLNGCALAMVYSPQQTFKELYDPMEALSRGTLYHELNKPLEVGGRCAR